MFIDAQRRIAAAMSDWFGVKIKGLPKMIPSGSTRGAKNAVYDDSQVRGGDVQAGL